MIALTGTSVSVVISKPDRLVDAQGGAVPMPFAASEVGFIKLDQRIGEGRSRTTENLIRPVLSASRGIR